MTGSARHLPWSLVTLIPSATLDRYSMSRRTLYRALAVAVAMVAIQTLCFEALSSGIAAGDRPNQSGPGASLFPPV